MHLRRSAGQMQDCGRHEDGFGFWTHQFQGAVTWYPMTNKGTAVVIALTYETNGKKEDFDLTPGDNLTLNWGISQFLPLKKDMSLLLEVGPAGYDTWQITHDTGSAATNTRDQGACCGWPTRFDLCPMDVVGQPPRLLRVLGRGSLPRRVVRREHRQEILNGQTAENSVPSVASCST
jgi:Putative MetA-pathway of phenol degradation